MKRLLERSGTTRAEVAASLGAAAENIGQSPVNGEDTRLDEALAALVAEGFLTLEGDRYYVRSG